MKKEKKNSIKKLCLRAGIGLLCFAGGLAGTFFLVPNRVNEIRFEDPEPVESEETHFSRFVSKIMKAADVDDSATMEGLVGTIDKLTVEWPDNKVEVNGSLALSMRSINDLDFTIDLNANYNGSDLDLGIGYTGRTFYLALNDLFIKSSYNGTQDVFEKIYQLFFNAEAPEDEGLGITVDFDGIVDSLIGNLDIGSLMSGDSIGGMGVTFGDEIEYDDGRVEAPLSISLSEDSEPLELSLFIHKDTDDLAGASLKNITIGDVKITGDINLSVFEGHEVYSFDNENYDGYHKDFKNKNFIEVVNYKSWFDDIFHLLNRKTIGLDLDFSVDQDDGTGPVNIGQIGGSIDVDASKFVLPIPKIIDASTFATNEIVVDKSIKRDANGEESVVETILDNLNAGITLEVNRDDTHYADLNLTYAEQNAYLSLNENVLKTKMDVQTLNFVIDKVTTLIEGDPNEKARKVMRGETSEETDLFDFITSSELVTAIKNGHYEGIIDLIEEISNTSEGITLKLDLSSLGLGENAKVELNLDATDNGEKGVTALKCTDIKMAEGIFNLDLNTREYKKENIDNVLNDVNSYEELDFAVGIFDQVTSILDSKKTGFALEGSLTDDIGLGTYFSGDGQLDYGEKYGFGNLLIQNHTDKENPTVASDNHPIKVYVDNTGNDKEINNMKLVYGPTGKLKGKLTVQSLEDVIGVVMKVVEKNDRRFAKFLDPIMKMIYESVIGQIISSKDYLQLANDAFVKSIKQDMNGTCLDIKLSKDLFAGFVTEDMTIRLNFKMNNNVKELDSLQIINLKLNDTLGNKIVNCKIQIRDFNESRDCEMDLTDSKYMNFSSVAILLQFLIDTTELNSYHLTATVNVNLGTRIGVASLPLDFYIEVIGEDTRVYGMFPNIPHIAFITNDASTDVGSEFLFEPAKHYDASSGDNVGGYFHIIRNENHHGLLSRGFEQYYYRATSKGFVDDIASYLLVSVLDFKYGVVSDVGNIDLSTSKGVTDYESMFKTNGFSYAEAQEKGETVSKWTVGMNLAKLSGIKALQSLDATISGRKYNAGGEEKSYLNAIDGILTIKASIITITVDAKIKLVDIDPTAHSWQEQFPAVHERFEKVCNVYNGLSAEAKVKYDEDFLNKPGSEKRIYIDSKMPSLLAALF